MKRLPLVLFPLLLMLAGCETASLGGGKNRYEYPPSKLATPKTVKAASLDGRFLILNDGSMWNINWDDANKARRWGQGDRLNVIATQGNAFPYVLIKQSSGERIAARYGKKLD
jgi:hypothetical protein